jgi:hypothetical protein
MDYELKSVTINRQRVSDQTTSTHKSAVTYYNQVIIIGSIGDVFVTVGLERMSYEAHRLSSRRGENIFRQFLDFRELTQGLQ